MAAFWSRVAGRSGRRAQLPFRARPTRAHVAIDVDLVWRALVATYAARSRKASSAQPHLLTRAFVDNIEHHDRRVLPRGSDGSLRGYFARLEAELQGRRFCLVINNLQLASFELFAEIGALLGGLYRVGGMPPYGVEAGVFIGNYESTSFGIHQDRVGVVMQMLEGHKRMRFWPPHALTSAMVQRHGSAYAPLLARATTITAQPGELVYWPAGFWHVGEAQGFSASLNLSLGTHGGTAANPDVALSASDRLADAVRSLLPRRSALSGRPLAELSRTQAKRADERAVTELRRTLAGGQLELELEAQRLRRATGFGFLAVPAPLTRAPKLTARAVVRAMPTRTRSDRRVIGAEGKGRHAGRRAEPTGRCLPTAWSRVGQHMVISANGLAFQLPYHPAIVRMLQRLAHGRPLEVGSLLRGLPQLALVDDVPTRIDAPLMRGVLQRLLRMRALV